MTVQHGAAAPLENRQLAEPGADVLDRGNQPVPDVRQVRNLPIQVHGPRHRPGGEVEAEERPVAAGVAVAAQRDPERIRAGDHRPGVARHRSVAVTPSVVAFAPESRVASSTEPATAATTEAATTAIRNRRCLESRAGGEAVFTRLIIPPPAGDSTEIGNSRENPELPPQRCATIARW